MKYEITKKAYAEVLETMGKYKDIIVYDYNTLDRQSKNHLFGVELQEKYGLDINPLDIHSLDYICFGDHRSIGWWGEKYRRTISWSDDGKQPEDELLLCLGFSTGAYIFGDDYPVELFQEFWQELKTYNFKYIDTTNKNLFFSMENAGKIFNEFPVILKRYSEINRGQAKERQIKKLQAELEVLNKPDKAHA